MGETWSAKTGGIDGKGKGEGGVCGLIWFPLSIERNDLPDQDGRTLFSVLQVVTRKRKKKSRAEQRRGASIWLSRAGGLKVACLASERTVFLYLEKRATEKTQRGGTVDLVGIQRPRQKSKNVVRLLSPATGKAFFSPFRCKVGKTGTSTLLRFTTLLFLSTIRDSNFLAALH